MRSLGWPLALALVLAAGALVGPRPACADQGTSAGKTTDAKDKTAAPVLTEDPEVRLGRESAEENDKQVKFVTDAALVERVNRIGQEIAAVANKEAIPALWGDSKLKKFNYTFKIVDDKDVNAYSLPGGFIYVDKGLLDFAHSDDELAGVLAHEIAHAAHHHMLKLLREQNKIDRVLLPLKLITLAVVLGARGNANDAQGIMLGSQLYTIAKINTYGIEAEKDADQTGIRLLTHTRYNPVGLYSFMLRLAVREQQRGPVELGIFRTHPPGPERAEAAKKLLEELNIPIHLSEVDPRLRPTVTLTKDAKSGAELAEIRIRDIVLCRVAAADGLSAQERGERIATRLNSLVDANLQPFEIKTSPDQTRVLARGFTILTQDDAAAQQKTVPALAREFTDAMSQYLLKQQLESGI
ncbi:MAG TPA: M48 family metalloprotease [Chthonomonadaceae bacterium]|nr:M48 family metalloprotease [Chthonomonadaceae bacterium]